MRSGTRQGKSAPTARSPVCSRTRSTLTSRRYRSFAKAKRLGRSCGRQVREGLASLRSGERVDHARAFAIKMSILGELHRSFSALPEGSERKRAYRAFVAAEEPELTRFATFQALDAHFGDRRPWPEEYRAPESSAVQTFARTNGAAVDLHRYLQFEIDRQLACVASAATQSRLRLGLYQDLAIGSAPGGSDTWAFPGLFVTGAAIGAPPDGYSKEGQDWGLPPLDPRALRAGRYRYFIRLVRNALRHAGALRIDHAVGLFRQFWIPQGLSGHEGAYVRFPAEDLLGILALESRRRMAIVVGEDLGTVPAEVPP